MAREPESFIGYLLIGLVIYKSSVFQPFEPRDTFGQQYHYFAKLRPWGMIIMIASIHALLKYLLYIFYQISLNIKEIN